MATAKHVVFVGPIKGNVVLSDGSEVDVTADPVEADSVEQAQQIADAVATRYVDEGHPTDPNFTYDGSESVG